jgi:hypothetical protein
MLDVQIASIVSSAVFRRPPNPHKSWCPGAELNHRHTDFQADVHYRDCAYLTLIGPSSADFTTRTNPWEPGRNV